ncbi:MAG: maleylpyruvate isomerase N-terminal domain-containing protein [Anaerolineae bacterium]|nr:maleylpyruvate isomerase N-terminal domain-containing protein [Anaerolineae bacterium]
MSKVIEKRRLLLEQLNDVVAHLLDIYKSMPDPNIMVYELWTAKDVLSHLTFWHESFARNVSDLVRDIKPTPLKGRLSDLNQAGVDAMKPYSLGVVMERLEMAQKTIGDSILSTKIALIPYKKGSRDYTPEEHLEIVINHISQHIQDVVKVSHS